jgi:hypothetical protein
LGLLGAFFLLCIGGFAACSLLVGKGVNDAVEDDKARAAENKKSARANPIRISNRTTTAVPMPQALSLPSFWSDDRGIWVSTVTG